MSRIGVILGGAYLALQLANEQLLKSLAGLVAVADILESLGGILAGDIEQNLLATTRKKNQSQQLVISQRFASLFLLSCLRGPRKKKEGHSGQRIGRKGRQNVRVLVDELAEAVDLVVDHDEEVLLGVVLGNVLVGVLLSRHDGRIESKRAFFFLNPVLGGR